VSKLATFQTYQAVGNREGLLDVLTVIAPTETWLLSNLGKEKVDFTYAEWMTQALPAAATNAAIEGAAWSAGTITARVRTGAYCQILRKCYTISRTQEQVAKAAVASEMAEQKKLALKNLAEDIEYELLNATGNSGASGTARALKGIRAWISTNNTTGTGTGLEALTESMFNDVLQAVKAQGGSPTDVLVGAAQKRVISAFVGKSTYATTIPAMEKTVVNVVDVYYGDFGKQRIHYHSLATASEVLALQTDMWKIGVLQDMTVKEVLQGACDGTSFGIVTELTLMSLNEAYSGKITQLSA
jgi:hypothetical protein